MSESIFIATPNLSKVRSEMACQHYAYALMALGRKYPDIEIKTGTSISNVLHRGYNTIYQEAKKVDADWFLTLEADMIVEGHTFIKLYEIAKERGFDHLAALYFENNVAEPKPLLSELVPKDAPGRQEWQKLFSGPLYRNIVTFPENTIVEVDATGLGCTLIRMDALRDVEGNSTEFEEDIFHTHFTRSGLTEYSEDIAISYLLQMQGYKILVHTGIQCGHESREALVIDEGHYRKQFEKAQITPDWDRNFDRTVQGLALSDDGYTIPVDRLPEDYIEREPKRRVPHTEWGLDK